MLNDDISKDTFIEFSNNWIRNCSLNSELDQTFKHTILGIVGKTEVVFTIRICSR